MVPENSPLTAFIQMKEKRIELVKMQWGLQNSVYRRLPFARAVNFALTSCQFMNKMTILGKHLLGIVLDL